MMKKTFKKVVTSILAVAIAWQMLPAKPVGAVPAVTDIQLETDFKYDAGYQMGDCFAFIEGGQWKETLSADAKVIFYNADTKGTVIYEAGSDGNMTFDAIEPLRYKQNNVTYVKPFYKIYMGNKQTVLRPDGTSYGDTIMWYDKVEACGDCLIVTYGDKREVLKDVDGALKTVLEQLPEGAGLSYDAGYYFLMENGQTTIYDEAFNKVEFSLPEGYAIYGDAYNTEQYANYSKCGYAVVVKETSSADGGTGVKKEANVIDKDGKMVFEESVEYKYEQPFCITEDYIWNGGTMSLYSTKDLQMIIDKAQVEKDFAEYMAQQQKCEISSMYFQEDCITVSLKSQGKEGNSYFVKTESCTYSEADGFKEPVSGDIYVSLNGEMYEKKTHVDGYLLKEETNQLYNFRTKETINLPAEDHYGWYGIHQALDTVMLHRVKYETVEDADGYSYNNITEHEYYLLKKDGTLEKCEQIYRFTGDGEAIYNLCGLEKADGWHWYMNSFDNEIMKTEKGPDNSNLEIITGYFQFLYKNDAMDSGNHYETYFYDQYGNVLLGEDSKYSIIGVGGIERNVLGTKGTIVGARTIQNGYTVAADENGKYGILKLSVTYTATGETQIIVESEDAGFVADDMAAAELKDHPDKEKIEDCFEKWIRINGLKKLDMKIFDITFSNRDGSVREPNGKVKVTISLPKDWDLSKMIKVYHMLSDNSVETLQCEIVDGKVVFYTNSFSNYAVVMAEKGQILMGDVDGDGQVNLTDAQLILKAALKIATLPEESKQAADLDKNGQISLTDAQTCLKVALKIITLE